MKIASFQIEETVRLKPGCHVYRAIHEPSGQMVSLKLTPMSRALGKIKLEELAPILWGAGAVGCLRAHEARVLERLDGQGTPRLVEYGVDEGRPYVAMQWLEGVSATFFPVDEVDRFAVVSEIGILASRILAEAHERGVIHRDLAPGNIILHRSSQGQLSTAIIDWELASLHEQRSIGPIGTSHFKAPETIALANHVDRLVDPRADLYSLGVILFRLAAGRLPFPEAHPSGQHVLQPAPSLATFCPQAPKKLVDVVDRLLQRHPDDRFASSAAVAEALQGAPLPPKQPPTGDVLPLGSMGVRSIYSVALSQQDSVDQAVLLATQLLDRGELPAAAQILELLEKGRSTAVLLTRARLLIDLERLASAEEILRGITAKEPDRWEARQLLVRTLRLQQRYDEALSVAEEAVATFPNSPECLLELTRCKLHLLPPPFSHADCLELIDRSPSLGVTLLKERIDRLLARNWKEPIIEDLESIAIDSFLLACLQPQDASMLSATLLHLAIEAVQIVRQAGADIGTRAGAALTGALFELGDLDSALAEAARTFSLGGFQVARELLSLTAEEIASPPTAHWMAILEFGRAALALQRSQSLVATPAASPQAWVARAQVGVMTGKPEVVFDALGHLPPELQARPDLVAIRALALLASNDVQKAVEAAKAAVQAHPETVSCTNALARSLLHSARPQEAIEAARTAFGLSSSPPQARLLFRAAKAADSLEEAVEALTALDVLSETQLSDLAEMIRPLDEPPLALREPLRKLALKADALSLPPVERLAQEMLRLFPGDRWWRQLLYHLLIRQDRNDQALRLAQEGLGPGEPQVDDLLLLADAASRTKDHGTAIASVEKAVELTPSDPILGWALRGAYAAAGQLEALLNELAGEQPAEQIASVLALLDLGQPLKAHQAARQYQLHSMEGLRPRELYLTTCAEAESWAELVAFVERSALPAEVGSLPFRRRLCQAFRGLGQYDRAIETAHMLAREANPQAGTEESLKALVASHQYGEAIRQGNEAMKAFGHHPVLLFLTGAALAGEGLWGLVRTCAEEICALEPSWPQGWWLACRSEFGVGRWTDALNVAENLVNSPFYLVAGHCTTGHIALSLDHLERARESARRCSPHKPSDRRLVGTLKGRINLHPDGASPPWHDLLSAYLD